MYVLKPFSSLNAEMGNENKNSQDEECWIDDQQDNLSPSFCHLFPSFFIDSQTCSAQTESRFYQSRHMHPVASNLNKYIF